MFLEECTQTRICVGGRYTVADHRWGRWLTGLPRGGDVRGVGCWAGIGPFFAGGSTAAWVLRLIGGWAFYWRCRGVVEVL